MERKKKEREKKVEFIDIYNRHKWSQRLNMCVRIFPGWRKCDDSIWILRRFICCSSREADTAAAAAASKVI